MSAAECFSLFSFNASFYEEKKREFVFLDERRKISKIEQNSKKNNEQLLADTRRTGYNLLLLLVLLKEREEEEEWELKKRRTKWKRKLKR